MSCRHDGMPADIAAPMPSACLCPRDTIARRFRVRMVNPRKPQWSLTTHATSRVAPREVISLESVFGHARVVEALDRAKNPSFRWKANGNEQRTHDHERRPIRNAHIHEYEDETVDGDRLTNRQ